MLYPKSGLAACHYKSQHSRGRYWYKGKWFIQMLDIWKVGGSCYKAHLHISVEAEVFIRREKGNKTKIKVGIEKFSTCKWTQSIPVNDGPVCFFLAYSSCLHIILAPGSKVSTSPRARMPKGQSLYVLKLVPRILIQTCCLSTSDISQSEHLQKHCQRMVGWDTISHCYNFPPLQCSWCLSMIGKTYPLRPLSGRMTHRSKILNMKLFQK